MRTAIDVSNYQPRDLSNLIQSYAPDTVIVRIQLPQEHIPKGYTLSQSSSAHSWGVEVGAYVWGYGDADPTETMGVAVEMYALMGAKGPLWLDCEADIDEEWVRVAIETGEALGVTVGIYTGYWWWTKNISGDYSRLPLWIADYGVEKPRLPGGWKKYDWWQWTSEGVDQSIEGEKVDEVKVTDGLNKVWDVKEKLEKAGAVFPELLEMSKTLFDGVVEIKDGAGLQ